MKQKKQLFINWLGACPTCGFKGEHKVKTTTGNSQMLLDGDKVTCGHCGARGVIETNHPDAWCEWDSQQESK